MKIISTSDRYEDFVKLLGRFKILMARIKTNKQFAAGQESGRSVVTYLESLILTHGTEEDILLLLSDVESDFCNAGKGFFYANTFYGIGNKFLK